MALATPAELREAFALNDEDRDGKLNVRQLLVVLAALGYLLTAKEQRDVSYFVDRLYYGLVTYEEFMSVLRERAHTFKTMNSSRDVIKAGLRAYGALPTIGGPRGALAASGPAAGITDEASLRRLLRSSGDTLTDREFAVALRSLRESGAIVGSTIDVDTFVDAISAEAEKSSSK